MRNRRRNHSRRTPKRAEINPLNNDVRVLIDSLAAIDRSEGPEWQNYAGAALDDASVDRRAAISALRAVESFLHSQGFVSAVLFQLRLDLKTVELLSKTPAIFMPARTAGRKAESKVVQGLKGRFAGMAYTKMLGGLSREQAVNWVARSIPDALARRVSKKPLRSSTIKEWMEQYGCTARVRRLLRSARTFDEFWPIVTEQIRSKHIEGSYGELECLRMIGLGQECLATGEPVPFQQFFDFFQQKYVMEILADIQS